MNSKDKVLLKKMDEHEQEATVPDLTERIVWKNAKNSGSQPYKN